MLIQNIQLNLIVQNSKHTYIGKKFMQSQTGQPILNMRWRVISVTKNRKKSVLAGINYPGAKNSRRVKNQFYKTRRISNLFVCVKIPEVQQRKQTLQNSADIRIQY